MTKVAPIQLPNGLTVYMEVDDDIQFPDQPSLTTRGRQPPGRPVSRKNRGSEPSVQEGDTMLEAAARGASRLTDVIEGIAAMVPAAFKNAAGADVEKVTLSFGIKMGGEAGIPLVTKGKAEGNIGILVECRYPGTKEAGKDTDKGKERTSPMPG